MFLFVFSLLIEALSELPAQGSVLESDVGPAFFPASDVFQIRPRGERSLVALLMVENRDAALGDQFWR